MSRLFRSCLVWMLLLALPVQGTLAATRAFCGAGHAPLVAVAAAAHASAHALARAPAQAHAHHEHGELGGAAMRDAEHAHHGHAHQAGSGADTSPAQDDAAQHKCSACAACCSAAALHSSVLPVPLPQAAATVFVMLVPRVEAVAIDGPDRPPRQALA